MINVGLLEDQDTIGAEDFVRQLNLIYDGQVIIWQSISHMVVLQLIAWVGFKQKYFVLLGLGKRWVILGKQCWVLTAIL